MRFVHGDGHSVSLMLTAGGLPVAAVCAEPEFYLIVSCYPEAVISGLRCLQDGADAGTVVIGIIDRNFQSFEQLACIGVVGIIGIV